MPLANKWFWLVSNPLCDISINARKLRIFCCFITCFHFLRYYKTPISNNSWHGLLFKEEYFISGPLVTARKTFNYVQSVKMIWSEEISMVDLSIHANRQRYTHICTFPISRVTSSVRQLESQVPICHGKVYRKKTTPQATSIFFHFKYFMTLTNRSGRSHNPPFR